MQILRISLVLHVIGFVLLVGTTFVDFIMWKTFWKQYGKDRQLARMVMTAIESYSFFFRVGGGLVILSGVAMVWVLGGAVSSQIWFQIKMGLIVVLILNIVTVAFPAVKRLRKVLIEDDGNSDEVGIMHRIKSRVNIFHLGQILIFVTIFVLSIYKFS